MALILKVKGADFSDTGLNPIIPTVNGFPKVGLQGLYLFSDESSSQVISDWSGNGNHLAKSDIQRTAHGYAFDDTKSAMDLPFLAKLQGTQAIAWHSKVPEGKSSNQNVIGARTIADSIYAVLYNTSDILRFLHGAGGECSLPLSSENWHLAIGSWNIETIDGLNSISAPNQSLSNIRPTSIPQPSFVGKRYSIGAQPSSSGYSNAIFGEIGVAAFYDRVLSNEEMVIVQNRINQIMDSRGVVLG